MELKLLRTVLALAFSLLAWGAAARWSAHKLVDHVNEHAKDPRYSFESHVKDFEIREFDMDGWRQSLGIQSDE